ncbi:MULTISPECIES: cobalamin-independent methionine synthase II family protein [unclassified Halomonas]|uniref:cobalamin-independent methionine synthase II family protein n=1 Tax=unclassified Halomonas TaxID=2609666 RepID=UPI00209D61D0|nr:MULTISPECIES: cobalamin-independent methionine synthase II family protein [unclassified Halomonas]MCP1316000.1 cobalamin-independent methionine synthase II family protein [Halomonas sp. 707D7]MCP1326694.1 cobalamin-independent methionine synthase II family protein [Halomonas sp. 707D4]
MVVLPTEAIGSIPRSSALMQAQRRFKEGGIDAAQLEAAYDAAVRDTLRELEATGSPIVTDGEQRKAHSFATYSVEGGENFAPDGLEIPFSDGHVRRLPRLTRGPFHFMRSAAHTLAQARPRTRLPMKQAIISVSAMSLFYPAEPLADYPREAFLDDLVDEQEREIRDCFAAGAQTVQIDFTEGRLALKIDPSGSVLDSFIELNNRVLERFTHDERCRIGIHTCPGADHDATHSADVDYAELLPSLFELEAGNFYIAMTREADPERALKIVARYLKPWQRAFIGVIDVIDPRIETPEQVCERVLQAARHIPLDQLGTTDDCGFSPFCDDVSTPRATAFAKIRARVEGTALAAQRLARGERDE